MGKSGEIRYAPSMQAYLKKHGPVTANHTIKVDWKREGLSFVLDFTVHKRNAIPWHTDPVFTQDWGKNWGLWNKDVMEVFLQLRQNPNDLKAPYLEIQVSPLNQPFALIIVEPRKTFHAPKILNFHSRVSLEDKNWTGRIELTLPNELKGSLLYGGCYSCLSEGPREFYALEPNPEANPDFHRPELFIPLDEQ